MFPTQTQIASTVPGNGDINPYGMAVVPRTTGALMKGDVLVSNFNAASNFQGTGTTIDQIAPDGTFHLFATVMPSDVAGRCPGGVGLTTALVALRSGWVIVGSLPTSDGTAATAMAGCLIVLNRWGHVAATIHGGLINGPWDMTAWDGGSKAVLFVTNVLNGTVAANGKTVKHGTVVRIDLRTGGDKPKVVSETVIGSGFAETTDPAALVIGPTGLALGDHGVLYVADTLDNRIAAIPNAINRMASAHRGMTVSENGSLNSPLGLAVAPNDDIIAMNAADGNGVEITPSGHQIFTRLLDSAGGGSLFGLVVAPGGHGLYFVADDSNTLQLIH
jgi:DNA-binding beta-propeller fold protein YncE